MFTNFEILDTGGNCTALIVTLADGRALFITDGDASAEPAADAYYIDLRDSYDAACEAGGDGEGANIVSRCCGDRGMSFLSAFSTLIGCTEERAALELLAAADRTENDALRRAILGAFDVCADTFYTMNRG